MPRLRGRVSGLKNRLVRTRFFRGHGVHSPFVYAIVRQVFMCRGVLGRETVLREALIAAGVSARRALELQNLMTHCNYRTFVLGGAAGECDRTGTISDLAAAELCILLKELPVQETLSLVREASGRGAAVVVMEPYAGRERERMCRAIVAGHGSTTVDNRGYLLIFNDKHLPKQHFRI